MGIFLYKEKIKKYFYIMTTFIILLLVACFGMVLYFLQKSTDNYIETLKEEIPSSNAKESSLTSESVPVKEKKVKSKKKEKVKQKAVKVTPTLPVKVEKKTIKKTTAKSTAKSEPKPVAKKRGRPGKTK